MNAKAFIITCKTNIHVGSGLADQEIIDNLVQRDHTDNLPCIYASSLKGALREYFEEYILKSKENGEKITQKDVNSIFGNPNKGSHIFHDAQLLCIPGRSEQAPYYLITAPMVINRLYERMRIFGLGEIPKNEVEDIEVPQLVGTFPNHNGLQVESITRFQIAPNGNYDFFKKIIGDKFIVVSNKKFIELTDNLHLPVIARNQLENGESKNLFYEQVLPRQTKFIFFTDIFPDKGENASTKFEDGLKDHIKKQLVQIGANSSIGYGYCHIQEYPNNTVNK